MSKQAWERAFTPHQPINGGDPHYGYGWVLGDYDSHPTIGHAGGIPGYVSYVLRMPRDHVYVAILMNGVGSFLDPAFVATTLAAVAIGEPYHEPVITKIDTNEIDSCIGTYRFDNGDKMSLSRDGDHVFMQRIGSLGQNGPKREAFPTRAGEFFLKDSFMRMSCSRDTSGRVIAVNGRGPDGWPMRATRAEN